MNLRIVLNWYLILIFGGVLSLLITALFIDGFQISVFLICLPIILFFGVCESVLIYMLIGESF
jgi:hypothetical protein